MMLNEFPCRVETPGGTWVNYRVMVERADPGPWRARLYSRDARLKAELPEVSRVVHLGGRQWLIIGREEAWRTTHLSGCGCSSSQAATDAAVIEWLGEIVANEPWEVART